MALHALMALILIRVIALLDMKVKGAKPISNAHVQMVQVPPDLLVRRMVIVNVLHVIMATIYQTMVVT